MYQEASRDIDRHRQTATDSNRQQQTESDSDRQQQTSTDIDGQQQTSTDILQTLTDIFSEEKSCKYYCSKASICKWTQKFGNEMHN